MPKSTLEDDLAALLNSYSLENNSNTPDFILAEYLIRCLDAYNVTLTDRARWYGRMDVPGMGSLPLEEAIEPMNWVVDDGPEDVAADNAADNAEALAQRFHETYERLAPSFGYETREASAKPWAQVPEQNRALMIAVCAEILATISVLEKTDE
jgi:hypothetical protein